MLRRLSKLQSWHFRAPRAPGIEESTPLSTSGSASCSLPLLIHQLGPINFWRKPGGGPGVWRQGAVNIDLWLTPDLVGGRLLRGENVHMLPACSFPASPPSHPRCRGPGERVKSKGGLGSNPSSGLPNKLSTPGNLHIRVVLQFLWL